MAFVCRGGFHAAVEAIPSQGTLNNDFPNKETIYDRFVIKSSKKG